MTTVMKVQFTLFAGKDNNTTISFEHLIGDQEEAKDLGESDREILSAYLDGYGGDE